MSDKPKKDMDIARKIWLAGIGAYGKAVGDAQDAYMKMGKETTKVFEDLVTKGTVLEGQVAEVATKIVPEITKNAKKQRAQVEDRMERMKAALGIAEVEADNREQMEAIEDRLDSLEAKIDEILKYVTPKKPAVRARAKKATAKTTAKKKT